MKFLYGYKTHENEMREGVIFAPSRDAVYRELKKQGVKPFKVDLAPGFGNWLASLGKRVYAIIVLCVVCLVLCAVVVHTRHSALGTPHSPLPRHQIYGDPALMNELERTGYSTAFPNEGDRVLARFAQPGVLVRLDQSLGEIAKTLAASIAIPDEEAVVLDENDTREVRELKLSVLWMRGELRDYLANGIGTPERYLRRLIERQDREGQVYFTAQNDLKGEKDLRKWERINASLRAMGLKTIPLPDDVGQEGLKTPVKRASQKN